MRIIPCSLVFGVLVLLCSGTSALAFTAGDTLYSTQKEVESVRLTKFEENERVTIVVQLKGEEKDLSKAFGNIPNMPNMVQTVKPKPLTLKYKYDDAPGLYRGPPAVAQFGARGEKKDPTMYLYFPEGEDWVLDFSKRWNEKDEAWEIKPDEVAVLGPDAATVGAVDWEPTRKAALGAINAGVAQRAKEELARISTYKVPKAAMKNAQMEAKMYKTILKSYNDKKWQKLLYKKVVIVEKDWTIWNHPQSGAVIGRSKEAAVFFKKHEDGYCRVEFFRFRQSWAGKGFQKSFEAFSGSDGHRIMCNKLAGFR